MLVGGFGFGKTVDGSGFFPVLDEGVDVDAVLVVKAAVVLGDADDGVSFSWRSLAELEPTLPKPCTMTRVPSMDMPRCLMASSQTTEMPRPVASLRPREPPRLTGLPVTTALTVWRICME